MKTLRLCLLVLLAVLLPIRGAVAAAMPCASTGMHHESGAVAMHAHHAGMAASGHDPAAHGEHHAGGAPTCNLCCDFCSMATLPGSPAALPLATNFATLSFPDLFAPLPNFLSDGQERPPRST
ncbi:MAG TPA: DUF2946 family protein [Burkholderiaceae bacterium]|nr:DUF2946 family protein [Burkholderiaceae bacterium]